MHDGDYQQDIGAALAEAIERSAKAPRLTQKLQVWAVLLKAGYDVPRLERAIHDEMADERRRKGRQQHGPYNRPPKELEKQFEAVVRQVADGRGEFVTDTSTKTKAKKGVPLEVRYVLEGPVKHHAHADLTEAEFTAWREFIDCGHIVLRGLNNGHYAGVHDDDRLAYTEYQLTLSQLPEDMQPAMRAVVEGKATAIQLGQWLLPSISDAAMRRAAGRTFIKIAGMLLLDLKMRNQSPERVQRQRTLQAQRRRELAAR